MAESQEAPKCLSYEGEHIKNPGSQVLTKLTSLVKHQNVTGVKLSIMEFRAQFLDIWKESPSHTDAEFVNLIRFISQREEASRHRLGTMSKRESITYFLGILAGIAYTSRELCTMERQDCQVVSACAQNAIAEKVLHCLNVTNGGHGMYHADLADKVGLSVEKLTEAMVDLLQCRAVAAVGTGSHTFYILDTIGKRYCTKVACRQEVEKDVENRDAD